MKKIIDVSSYNGVVNWKRAKEQGVSGAIIKIIRKDLTRDNQFNANYKGCESIGMPWGVYNYSYATTASKAKSDMNLVCDILDKISKKHFSLGVWFDIEDKAQEKLSQAQIASILNAAKEVVEKRGYPFGVYTGLAFYKAHIHRELVECKNWWIARYYKGYDAMGIKSNPNEAYKPLSDIVAWQYTSSGRFSPAICKGNEGNVDLNVLYKDISGGKKGEEKKTYDREKVVAKAKSYLGAKEGSAAHKEILGLYNENEPLPQNYIVKPTDAWCATFSSAMYIACGYADIFPIECSCSRMIEKAKAMKIWQENDAYIPDVGDAVLYDWQDGGKGDNRGNPDHIGLVVSVDRKNKLMKIIEGNYHDKVDYRNISTNGRYIRGFITPKFNTNSGTQKKEEEKKPEKKHNAEKALTVDGKMGEKTTRRAQEVFGTTVDGRISNQLNAYKSICKAILTAEWGNAKRGGSSLVKAIQKWIGAKPDGYIGPDTIKRLQKKLGTTVDGKLDNPSQCIKAFQRWLNRQK